MPIPVSHKEMYFGPLLFIIYTSDLLKLVTNSLSCYSDDVALVAVNTVKAMNNLSTETETAVKANSVPPSYIKSISDVTSPDVPVIHHNSRKSKSKTVAFQTQPNISCCDYLCLPDLVADDPTYPKCCLHRCRKPWT